MKELEIGDVVMLKINDFPMVVEALLAFQDVRCLFFNQLDFKPEFIDLNIKVLDLCEFVDNTWKRVKNS